MAELNRLHFNEEASTYDAKHSKLDRRLTQEIQARLDWIGVDWAPTEEDDDDSDDSDESDSGNESKPEEERAAAPPRREGLSRDEMSAVVGDLTAADGPQPSDLLADPRFFGFDVAVVGGGLHHFAEPERAAERLVERLRPGGVLLIWDFAPHGPIHGHGSHHAVLHHGLSEDRVRNMFERAGAGKGFSLEVLGSGVSPGCCAADGQVMRREVFLARGEKAA